MRLSGRRVASIAGCAVFLGALPTLVAATSGRSGSKNVALTCGQTVTTSVTLTADMHCAGKGLAIGKDGITVNLNGHTLTGSGIQEGIFDAASAKVTIKNG